jgi:hypothetical protein
MLPDDGPNGQKHVGAIWRDILSMSCSIYILRKITFVGKNALNLYLAPCLAVIISELRREIYWIRFWM